MALFLVSLVPKGTPIRKIHILISSIIGLVAGTIGAKLFHLLLYAEDYRGMSVEEVFINSGYAAIGAIVFILIAVAIYLRRYGVSLLIIGDFGAPYFLLSRVIGRIGCLLTGCCHGPVTKLPWALYFRDGLLRHPTQAYMIVLTSSIFIAGVVNYRRSKDKPGIIFFSTIIMYGLGRFIAEFFRVDSPTILGPIKFSHIILVPLFLYGAVGLYILYRRYSADALAAVYVRRIFATFLASAVIMNTLILTTLSVLPKKNFRDDIDIVVDRYGIRKLEKEKVVDYERIEKIQDALERYKLDTGTYPTQQHGLNALVEKPKTRPIPTNWRGPYIEKGLLSTEKGKPYIYTLSRHGDALSYKIITPIEKKPTLYPVKEQDYVLEVEVHHALTLYKLDNKRYPTQEQGLKALIEKPKIEPIPENWNGPYLEGPLKDKKGRPYRYKLTKNADGESYLIYTE